MFRILLSKLKESVLSVLPVTLIVLIIYFTPLVSLSTTELVAFIISALFLVLGISLFNLGADLAMTRMGELTGSALTKSRNLILLLSVCFVMGLLITVAEPDLTVLAEQVKAIIDSTALIVAVGVGVGIFLVLAVVKTVFKVNLARIMMFFYMALFALCALLISAGKADLLPLAFDSGGVTTGPITVPFIMALGLGISVTVGGKHSNENSFGYVALCSIGPMLAVIILSIMSRGSLVYEMPDYSVESKLGIQLLSIILKCMEEVALALGLIVLFFAVLQIFVLKLPRKMLIQIGVGLAYTFVGLVMFLTAVSVGFMPVGFKIGTMIAGNSKVVAIIFAFGIGMVTVLAEPAVHILNNQVEEITGGSVTKRSMLIALSVGVGASIALSVVRIIFGFSLLYYLIPGYLLSLGLSFFVPKLYTAIAFDSGGVASGPLTSSFILPMAIGICYQMSGVNSIMSQAFGVVAMVAMTPLIAIQMLGFRAILADKMRARIEIRRILSADDEQIINFDWEG